MDNFEPKLTLDPFNEEKKEISSIKKESSINDYELTEEEQKMVDDFAKSIDLKNTGLIIQYGAGTQKKIADFSQGALESVRTKDMGEVGDLLSGVVGELKGFDEEEDGGFFSFLNKPSKKIESLKDRYNSAEKNVNKIVEVLEGHQIQLIKDTAMLDTMYNMNLNYLKELNMYIMAGKQKLEEVRKKEIPSLMEKADTTSLSEDAQNVKDLDDLANRFEKKLHDLELTRMIGLQMAPQIRLVQNNDTMMAEKIQSTLVNTIPLWKSQMVLALGIEHSLQASKAQKEVTDMTNKLLKSNAEKIKMSTIETAKATERGIADLETIKGTNKSLITTLDDVLKIQKDGRERRLEAEKELAKMELELKNKLLEISD